MYKNIFISIKRAFNEQKRAGKNSDMFQDQKSFPKFVLNQVIYYYLFVIELI